MQMPEQLKIHKDYHSYLYICLYALGITGAEIVTAYFNPVYGIAFHLALLIALLVHSSLYYGQTRGLIYMALCLGPLIRIMGQSMPLLGIPPMYWYLIISLPLFAAGVAVLRVGGVERDEIWLTMSSKPLLQVGVAVLGLPLGLMEYLILRPEPLAPQLTFNAIWLPALILIVSTGFLEEFIFRGVMLRAAMKIMGRGYAILFISYIFGIMHITHRSPLDLVFVFAVSLLFSIVVGFFRSLLGVSLAHGFTNIGLYIIWPHIIK